jgi:hypothetical protein
VAHLRFLQLRGGLHANDYIVKKMRPHFTHVERRFCKHIGLRCWQEEERADGLLEIIGQIPRVLRDADNFVFPGIL